ncbi:MAG: cereblon family protein [Acidobacteriota bacterium]
MSAASVIAFEALQGRDLDGSLEKQKAREDSGHPIRCAQCGQPVSTTDQRMEQAGSHAHRFENPAGIVFRIGCFRHAPGCRHAGEATLEWTWFPGHAWSMALCIKCGTHLGWYFGPGGTGDAFYGLILHRLAEET